jgi:uncharacterized membrane protein YadS
MGTLVKLIRVLMLGPVVLVLSLLVVGRDPGTKHLPDVRHMIPWFILGFLALVAARSAGVVPAGWLGPISQTATWLTIVAMAALGLGVDVRVIAKAGPRVIAVVTLSLLSLGAVSLGLIALLRFG